MYLHASDLPMRRTHNAKENVCILKKKGINITVSSDGSVDYKILLQSSTFVRRQTSMRVVSRTALYKTTVISKALAIDRIHNTSVQWTIV